MFRNLIVFLFAISCSITAKAKPWDSAYIQKLIGQGELDKVIDHYKSAYASRERDPLDAIRIADLCVQKKDYPTAVTWYEKEKAYCRKTEASMLNLARAYRMTGNYQDALDVYMAYMAETGDINSILDEAIVCERLIRASAFADHYFFEPYSFNSDMDEAQLSTVRGSLSYTLHTPGSMGRPWEAVRQHNGWVDPVPLLSKPKPGAYFHHLAINKNDNQCVYTLKETLPDQNGSKTLYRLYLATYLGGTLLQATPFPYNAPGYSCREACFSEDGQQLYFASDMPGGQGGYDIWMCTRENPGWGKPQNLGKFINTPAQETSPYYTIAKGIPTLFFASTREGGFGGSDIYKATYGNKSWQSTEMMPGPVNSPANENSYVFDPESEAGYISSDRNGGKGDADIYRVRPLDIRLIVAVRDSASGTSLDYAYLRLYDNNTLINETVTGNNGKSVSQLGTNRNYKLTVSKDKYQSRTISFSTQGKSNGDSVCINISMQADTKFSPKYATAVTYDHDYIVFMGRFSDPSGKTIRPGMRMLNLNTNKLRILDIDEQGAYCIRLMTNNNYRVFIEYEGLKFSEEITTSGMVHGSIKLKNYVWSGDQLKAGENRILEPAQVPDSLRYLWQEIQPVQTANDTALLTSLPKGKQIPGNSVDSANTQTPGDNYRNNTDIYYKIQIGSYDAPKPLPGLEKFGQPEETVSFAKYIYRFGNFSDIQDVKNKLEQIRQLGYDLAFILQYRNNEVINIIK